MALTILEMAANVRQKKAELDATCAALRGKGGDWTAHAIAGEDAMKIADSGLSNCWAMLSRLDELAREELKKLPSNAEVSRAADADG